MGTFLKSFDTVRQIELTMRNKKIKVLSDSLKRFKRSDPQVD
jgi:hypothetical protein